MTSWTRRKIELQIALISNVLMEFWGTQLGGGVILIAHAYTSSQKHDGVGSPADKIESSMALASTCVLSKEY